MTYRPLLLLLCSATLCQCTPEEASTVQPQRRDLTEAVYASATVQPAEQYRVFPEAGGIVAERAVEVGDTVREGQLLFRIRNTTAELQEQSARLNYELAQDELAGQSNQLAELERQVTLTRRQLQQDSLDLARQRDLWAQRIGSQSQVEQRELALANSRARYQGARDALVQARRRLTNQARLARTQLAIDRDRADQFVIASRMNGRVYELSVEAGELVTPQQPLATIGSLDSFILVLQIDEEDIRRVELGQTVYVRLDSDRERVLRARVSRIDPSMNLRTQTFAVEAAFAEPAGTLYPNLSAEANIVIRSQADALVIPRALLLPGDSVLLADGRKVAVVPGISDLRFVEIRQGLDEQSVLAGSDTTQ